MAMSAAGQIAVTFNFVGQDNLSATITQTNASIAGLGRAGAGMGAQVKQAADGAADALDGVADAAGTVGVDTEDASDDAAAALDDVARAADAARGRLHRLSISIRAGFESAGDSFASFGGKWNQALELAGKAVEAVQLGFEKLDRAERLKNAQDVMDQLVEGADGLRMRLSQAGEGAFLDSELTAAANKMLLVGVQADTIVEAVGAAAKSSLVTGEEATAVLDTLTEALKTAEGGSFELFGQVVDLGKAYQDAATKMGITVEALTSIDRERIAIDKMAEAMEKAGVNVGSLTRNMQQAKTEATNFFSDVGVEFGRWLFDVIQLRQESERTVESINRQANAQALLSRINSEVIGKSEEWVRSEEALTKTIVGATANLGLQTKEIAYLRKAFDDGNLSFAERVALEGMLIGAAGRTAKALDEEAQAQLRLRRATDQAADAAKQQIVASFSQMINLQKLKMIDSDVGSAGYKRAKDAVEQLTAGMKAALGEYPTLDEIIAQREAAASGGGGGGVKEQDSMLGGWLTRVRAYGERWHEENESLAALANQLAIAQLHQDDAVAKARLEHAERVRLIERDYAEGRISDRERELQQQIAQQDTANTLAQIEQKNRADVSAENERAAGLERELALRALDTEDAIGRARLERIFAAAEAERAYREGRISDRERDLQSELAYQTERAAIEDSERQRIAQLSADTQASMAAVSAMVATYNQEASNLQKAMGGFATVSAQIAGSWQDAKKNAPGMIASLRNVGAAFTEDKKIQAVTASMFEFAAGWASYPDPVGMTAHFTAAALFAALAGTTPGDAGGGTGAGAGAVPGASLGGGGSGGYGMALSNDLNVVHNHFYAPVVGSDLESARTLNQIGQKTWGTGYENRPMRG